MTSVPRTAARQHGLVPLGDDIVSLTYARVSTDDQEKDGMSLPVQDAETLAYISRHDWPLEGRYVDVETGAHPTRHDYQRLKAHARSLRAVGKRVRIVVVKQSRFGRDIEELGRSWRELVRELDVEIHSTRDGGHIRDELMFLIRGAMNHNELTVISEGVRNSFARIREHGWLKPGRRRWGYRWEPATAEQRGNGSPTVVPVPDEHEADYVRELFRRRAAGDSYRALMDWVHQLPAEARGVRKQDGPPRELGFSAIANVLSSPAYVGRLGAFGDDVLDRERGKWEPLVDDATWATIHPRQDGSSNVVPISVTSEYLLTRFIFCEACGGRMQGHVRRLSKQIRKGRTKPPSGQPKRQYVCGGEKLGVSLRTSVDGKRCHRSVPADTVDRLVLGTFAQLVSALAMPDLRTLARDEARKLDERQNASGDARRLINAEQDLARVKGERIGLTRALAAGGMSQEAYDEAYAAVSVEVDRYAAEVARLSDLAVEKQRRDQQRPLVDVILDQAPFWAQALEHGSVDDQRAFLRLVLDRCTPRRTGPGQYLAGMQLTATGQLLLEVGALLLPALGWHAEDVQLVQANCTSSACRDGAA